MDELLETEPTEIIRRSLLDRLDLSRLKIVAITAPAGFGKSTLARQIVRSAGASAVVDCAGVSDDLDFTKRILPALAVESPNRTSGLTRTQLMLADEATSISDRADLALDMWQAPAPVSCLVFENAEHLLEAPSAHQFLARLMLCCPNHRAIVLCSREDLRLHLTRFAAPHRIVKLRAEDLTFDRDEMVQIFEPLSVGPAVIERVQALSQGWPIAVFLLARFAQEGRLEALLGQLDDVAFEDIHEYLADQVLARLDPQIFAALVAAAFSPNATEQDITRITHDPKAAALFASFERTSPFVSRSADGEFIVHPLISAMLLLREGAKRNTLLQEAAGATEAEGDALRAAELYYAAGNHIDAARVLETFPLESYHAPSMRYTRALAALEPALIKRHPTLWSCNAMLKLYSSDSGELLSEATEVWNSLDANTPIEKRYNVFSIRVLCMSYVGRFREAEAFIESVLHPPVPQLRGYVLYLRATVTARLGRLREAEADLNEALPLVQSMDVMGSTVLMLLGAEVARARGDWALERELLDRAIAATLPSDLWNVIVQRYAEAAFGAWVAGDDEDFVRYGQELARIVDDNSIRGLRYYANCVRNAFLGKPQKGEMPRFVLCGHLIAYGAAPDAESAAEHARLAVELATRYGAPFLTALALLALAESSEDVERRELRERACRESLQVDSEAFQAAVRAASEGLDRAGMLTGFIAKRLRPKRGPLAPRLQIDILRGEVEAGGLKRTLANRELALLFMLAVRRQTVSAESIVDELWPDVDETSARNALYVCLRRLRTRLADDGAIVRTRGGFRLCDEARVDLWEIRDRVSALRGIGAPSVSEHDQLAAIYEQLCGKLPAQVASWEWFQSTERLIDELRSAVGLRLANNALERRDFSEAVDTARSLIEYDACDEPAHELIIAAYLQMGDRAMALRSYRQYGDRLRREFQCEPSDHVAALVRGASSSGPRDGLRLAVPMSKP